MVGRGNSGGILVLVLRIGVETSDGGRGTEDSEPDDELVEGVVTTSADVETSTEDEVVLAVLVTLTSIRGEAVGVEGVGVGISLTASGVNIDENESTLGDSVLGELNISVGKMGDEDRRGTEAKDLIDDLTSVGHVADHFGSDGLVVGSHLLLLSANLLENLRVSIHKINSPGQGRDGSILRGKHKVQNRVGHLVLVSLQNLLSLSQVLNPVRHQARVNLTTRIDIITAATEAVLNVASQSQTRLTSLPQTQTGNQERERQQSIVNITPINSELAAVLGSQVASQEDDLILIHNHIANSMTDQHSLTILSVLLPLLQVLLHDLILSRDNLSQASGGQDGGGQVTEVLVSIVHHNGQMVFSEHNGRVGMDHHLESVGTTQPKLQRSEYKQGQKVRVQARQKRSEIRIFQGYRASFNEISHPIRFAESQFSGN